MGQVDVSIKTAGPARLPKYVEVAGVDLSDACCSAGVVYEVGQAPKVTLVFHGRDVLIDHLGDDVERGAPVTPPTTQVEPTPEGGEFPEDVEFSQCQFNGGPGWKAKRGPREAVSKTKEQAFDMLLSVESHASEGREHRGGF